MNQFENERNKKVFRLIIRMKIIYISFVLIAISSTLNINIFDAHEYLSFIMSVVLLSITILIYLFWMITKTRKQVYRSDSKNTYIEVIIYILLYMLVLSKTGLSESGYKILAVFIIIITSLEYGRNYSSIVSIILSGIILITNVLVAGYNRELLVVYFETDLLLIAVLAIVALIIGMYVDVEKNHGYTLRGLAITDELTSLFNHRYFQEMLSKNIETAKQEKKKVSLLFLDIDFFKDYNDINGHQAGDRLLKDVSKVMLDGVRDTDVVCRYGGEEFAIILDDTGEKEAIDIAENIRSLIELHEFKGQENQPNENLTVSIGVSTYPDRASSKQQLLNTVDDALYRAKSFKKNRVESYYNVLDKMTEEMNVDPSTISDLNSFINKVNLKDRYTHGHTERVVLYAKTFMEYLELSEEDKVNLQIGAYLHDIGKLKIPAQVLNKKEKLTDDEFNMLRSHPLQGVKIIQDIEHFKDAIPIIKHHHERFDGRGYPDNLKGEQIPYLARILTIVDSFDAMTSNRPYNTSKTYEEGIREIRNCKGTQFDPVLAEQFATMLEKHKLKL